MDGLPSGLCASCLNARSVRSARGSTFLLCRMSETDRSYPRYPPLPVLRCRAFVAREGGAENAVRPPTSP